MRHMLLRYVAELKFALTVPTTDLPTVPLSCINKSFPSRYKLALHRSDEYLCALALVDPSTRGFFYTCTWFFNSRLPHTPLHKINSVVYKENKIEQASNHQN